MPPAHHAVHDDAVALRTFEALGVAETAAALADPTRVEAGVRSLLAHLGLGVYRASDLEPLHRGSERGPEDFWLYDFQLAALASMAQGPPHAFLDYHERLVAVGFDGDALGLVERHRAAYAGSTAFLPSLFAAQSLDLGVSPEDLTITPLQEWLLLLDAFVPPNAPGAAIAMGDALTGAAPSAAVLVSAPHCAGIGGAAASGWGHASGPTPPDMVDPVRLSELLTAVHMMTRRLEPAFAEVHHRHPDPEVDLPPDTVEFSATVAFPEPPMLLVLCNPASPWQRYLGPATGGGLGLRDVIVWWEVPYALTERHGDLRTPYGGPGSFGGFQLTDGGGVAALTFHARDEEAEGRGLLRTEVAHVTARFDVSAAMAPLLAGIDARLIGYLPTALAPWPPGEGVIVIEVGWHEAPPLQLSAFAIPHPMGWPKAYGLAGAAVGFVPWKASHRSNLPYDLLEPVLDECGFWTQGHALDGEHVFEVFALHDAGHAEMRFASSADEEWADAIAITFEGSGAARPVATVASKAIVKAETGAVSGDATLAGPAMLVIDVVNPQPPEPLDVTLTWRIVGDKEDEDDYAEWWAEASLWVHACGWPEEAGMLFMLGSEAMGPSIGTHTVRTTEERIQLHVLLEAGLYAHAFNVSHEPDVVSSARIEGELLITARRAGD